MKRASSQAKRPRVVVITGGSRGLGEALAKACALKGDFVWCISRGGSAPKRCRGLRADVRDQSQLDGATAEISATAGAVDLWINNAGGGSPMPFETPQFDRWRATFTLNFDGVVHGCRAAVRVLRRPGGSVINVASLAGLMAPSGHSSYATAKAAVIALTRSLAVEYAVTGLRFNAIAPGPIQFLGIGTRQMRLRAQSIPTGRLISPAEIVSACLWLSGPFASITGHTVVIDGGAQAAGCYV